MLCKVITPALLHDAHVAHRPGAEPGRPGQDCGIRADSRCVCSWCCVQAGLCCRGQRVTQLFRIVVLRNRAAHSGGLRLALPLSVCELGYSVYKLAKSQSAHGERTGRFTLCVLTSCCVAAEALSSAGPKAVPVSGGSVGTQVGNRLRALNDISNRVLTLQGTAHARLILLVLAGTLLC